MNFMELKYSKLITAMFVVLFAVTAGLIISNALKNFFSSDHWSSFLIMILFGIILIIPLIISLIKKRFDLFEPIFLWVLIYGFLYLAKPFAQLLTTEPFKYGSEFLNKALLLAILGLICFYAGYYGVFGRKIAKKIPVISDSVSSKKLFWIGWFFIALGFWGLNHYIQISGGWQVFWQKPHGLAGLAIKSTAYIYELPELMVIGFILIYEIFIHRIIIEKKAVKIQNILGLIMAAIGGLGIYTIIWGSRTYFSWIIIAAVVLYFLKKQTKPKLKTIIIGIFVLFIVLSLIPIYRQYMYLGSNFSKITSDIKLSKILRVAFNPLDEFSSYLAEVALVPNSIPYGYFHLYAQTLLHPIPRLIWPNKPAFFNPNWDDFLSKSGMGWGAAESMLGDFYAQLGTWGIIICTFLSGILWRTFYEYLRKAPTNRSVILIYAIILPNMFTYVAQSALIGFLKWAPYMVPSTIIALLLSRAKKKDEDVSV